MNKLIKIIYVLFIFIILMQNKSIEASTSTYYSPSKRYVYITLDGSKYHLAGCDYLDGRPYKISLEWAIDHGYGPCKHCKPFIVEDDNTIVIAIIVLIISIFVIGIVLYFYKKRPNNSKKQRN